MKRTAGVVKEKNANGRRRKRTGESDAIDAHEVTRTMRMMIELVSAIVIAGGSAVDQQAASVAKPGHEREAHAAAAKKNQAMKTSG